MSPEIIKKIYDDFVRATKRLDQALEKDATKEGLFVDAAIQRFEFTFALGWKLARAILIHGGIDFPGNFPRSIIKEAFRANIIQEGQEWLNMLEDRNKTSYIYDEEQALEIYNKIKKEHFLILKSFVEQSARFLE